MAKNISTRRAKIEERQARRQAFLAIVLVILIGLFFLFVMLPLILRAAISLARNENPFQSEIEDTLPPQKPVTQPIPEFQSEKKVEISGYTEANAKVSLFADGNELTELTADDSGAFTFATTLEEGEHKLWLLAEDEAGNSSGITETYAITIDTTKPTLEITEPENNKTFSLPREKTITIAGKMSEKGRVFVNNSRNTTDQEGNFSTRVQLGEGENSLVLIAEDEAGNRSEEQQLTVTYAP